MEETLLN